jgi:hypothetical protein
LADAHGASPNVVKFCFEAACWNRVLRAQVSLQQVLRQKDEQFVRVLNQLRVGVVTPDAERLLAGSGKDIRALAVVRPRCRRLARVLIGRWRLSPPSAPLFTHATGAMQHTRHDGAGWLGCPAHVHLPAEP